MKKRIKFRVKGSVFMKTNIINRILSSVVAGTLILSCAGTAISAAGNDIVYTYQNENGQIINITQEQLDIDHWNKEALETDLPMLYEEFPIKLDQFITDYGDVSLEIQYLKINMDSVNLKIKDLQTDEYILNRDINEEFFYSPVLEVGKQYIMELTETINGETETYQKGISVDKSESKLSDYLKSEQKDNDKVILAGDVDELRAGESINENGQLVIDSTKAKYDKVNAGDFSEYIKKQAPNKTYRLYATIDDERIESFVDTNNYNYIYDIIVEAYDINAENIQTLSMDNTYLTQCDNLTFQDIRGKGEQYDITDACFFINEPDSLNLAYRVLRFSVPQNMINEISAPEFDGFYTLRLNFSGSQSLRMRYFIVKRGTTLIDDGVTDTRNTSNSANVIIPISNYSKDYVSGDPIEIYAMLYLKSATSGYGMVNFKPIEGYDDDITGSIWEAYKSTTRYDTMSEYTMLDSWDIDAFGPGYGTEPEKGVYKIELRNRSLADQALLESGVYAEGSKAKQIIGYSCETRDSFPYWSEHVTYSVAKNQDVVLYRKANEVPQVYAVRNKSTGTKTSEKYQFACKLMGNN